MSLELAVRGVLLLLLGLLVVLSNWGPTRRRERKPTRRFSWAFFLSIAVGLACIALLRSTDSFERAVEWQVVCLATIPICVVFASVFAVSYWEPLIMPLVLYLTPAILQFMPFRREFAPLEYLGVATVLSLLTAVPGCLTLYFSRKLRNGQWAWSLVRGLGWGLPCVVGSLFAFRNKLSSDIAFDNDYTLVWVILAEVVVVTGIAGLRRRRPETPQGSGPEKPTVDAPPSTTAAPAGWRVIRNYSELFPIGRKINYPAGVAFILAALVGVTLRSLAYMEVSSLGEVLPRQFLIGFIHALLDGALFVLISRQIRQVWMLPVVWGVVSETTGFIAVVVLGAPVELVARVSLYNVVAAALFMTAVVFAVQAWGPRLGSLIAGGALSVVPLWIYGSITSMPAMGYAVQLIYRVIFAVLFFFALRYYFEGRLQSSAKAPS